MIIRFVDIVHLKKISVYHILSHGPPHFHRVVQLNTAFTYLDFSR